MISSVTPQMQQPVFKGIVLKKIPPNEKFSTLVDLIQAASPTRQIKGSNRRMNRDVLALDITTSKDPIIRCMTPKIEDEVFNNLSAKRDMIPGVVIDKINDWA